MSVTKLIECNAVGLWGLFWYDDNGVMAEKCFNTGIVGGRASFSGYPRRKKKTSNNKKEQDDDEEDDTNSGQ